MINLTENSWLAQHIDDPQTRIIDPRPRIKYLQGHIPKALNLPLSEFFDKQNLSLYSHNKSADIIGGAGVDLDSTVVLYDSYDGQSAAMLAWLLEYLGDSQVSILSNYIEGWAKTGGKILYRAVENEPKKFSWKTGPSSRASINEVREKGNAKLLDLRGEDEFYGKISTEPRPGHIPGAANLPWTKLIGEDGNFLKSQSELERVFAKAELNHADQIITYCSNGPRAALGYIALQKSGFKDVRVYDGSFHEWTRRQDLPVEQRDSTGVKSKPVELSASPCVVELPGLTGPK